MGSAAPGSRSTCGACATHRSRAREVPPCRPPARRFRCGVCKRASGDMRKPVWRSRDMRTLVWRSRDMRTMAWRSRDMRTLVWRSHYKAVHTCDATPAAARAAGCQLGGTTGRAAEGVDKRERKNRCATQHAAAVEASDGAGLPFSVLRCGVKPPGLINLSALRRPIPARCARNRTSDAGRGRRARWCGAAATAPRVERAAAADGEQPGSPTIAPTARNGTRFGGWRRALACGRGPERAAAVSTESYSVLFAAIGGCLRDGLPSWRLRRAGARRRCWVDEAPESVSPRRRNAARWAGPARRHRRLGWARRATLPTCGVTSPTVLLCDARVRNPRVATAGLEQGSPGDKRSLWRGAQGRAAAAGWSRGSPAHKDSRGRKCEANVSTRKVWDLSTKVSPSHLGSQGGVEFS